MENVWALLKGGIKISYKSLKQLNVDIIKSWDEIDNQIIFTLFESMPKRIEESYQRKGGYTKY
jgi:hypothetical protein